MKKKIIIYSILLVVFISISLLIKRYQFSWPDIGAALGILTLVLLFLIQLIFFKNRKITLTVGLFAIALYVLILQLIYIDWPQGLNGDLSIKANYESYNWDTAKPEDFGVSSKEIEKEIKLLNNSEFISSFLLIKSGKLIVERYFHGADVNSAFNIKSSTKGILSALVGIAIDKGYIKSVNDKMIDYLHEYKNQLKDTNKLKITIKDLLTMQEGLDVKPSAFRRSSLKEALIESEFNQKKYKSFEYSDESPVILSNIITRVSGLSTYDFAVKELFNPIDIHVRKWAKSVDGIYLGGADSYFTARDMARFGYLYLQNGNINGKQIVPVNWIKESTISCDGAKMSDNSCYTEKGYGYLWWIGVNAGYNCYAAHGYGGQAIVVIPDLDMIMVFTHYWRNEDKKEKEAESFCRIIKMFTK
jgi:CubicO group peptidase (beta-lactamase class C family)